MTSEKSKFPLGAVVAVAAIALVSVFYTLSTDDLSGMPFMQPTSDHAVLMAKRSLAETSDNSIIFVGDSSTLHGIMPSVITDVTDHKVINLATTSSMATAGFSELANYALQQNDIKAVVFAILPRSLAVTREFATTRGLLGRYLAAYGREYELYNVSIKDRLNWFINKHRFNIFPGQFGGSFGAFTKALQEENGFFPEWRSDLKTKTVKNEFSPEDFSIEPLLALEATATGLEVPIYFLLNPTPKSSQTTQYVEEVNAFWTDFQQENPDLQFLSPSFAPRENFEFGTATHLNPEHAEKYSRQIATLLAEKLSPKK